MSRNTHTWYAPYTLHAADAGAELQSTLAFSALPDVNNRSPMQMSVRNCFIRGSVVRYVQVRMNGLGLINAALLEDPMPNQCLHMCAAALASRLRNVQASRPLEAPI